MNRYRQKIGLFLSIVLFMQLLLPGSMTSSHIVKAAAAGPILTSKSPADDFTNVGLNAPLIFTFDEPVAKGTGSASFTIYNYTLNTVFESYNVATDGRVSIDATGRTVTVRPSKAFNLNTDYYVLIDPGTFVNVSNGANYSGIANATEWNFKTVETVDTTAPVLIATYPASEQAGIAITSPITLVFNKIVYIANGDLSLVTNPSSTAYEERKIPVTSSQVTGSGTNTITITPATALYPNSTYTFTIPRGVLQDATGNVYQGQIWQFTTAPAPVNVIGLSPADNATSVPVTNALAVAFDKEIVAGANKYIHLIRAYDNYDERILAADISRVTISGNVVTIRPQKMLANTRYYVLIDAGAFVDKNTGNWFQGISNASTWDFTTDPGDEKDPPLRTAVFPAHGGAIGTLNSNLEITFNEPVYPDSGNIEIRNVVNNVLFRSIPVTSDNVTGGGTNKITINPNKALHAGDSNKAFVNNSQYYVVIGNRGFRDAAGNYFAGVTANSWQFRVTQDTVKPTLESVIPANNTNNVLPNAYFSALFSKTVVKGTGSIWIRPVGSTTAQPVQANYYVNPDNNKQIVIVQPTGTVLAGNTNYYIEISPDAVTDLAGNAYAGIQNQYQWAFKTIGEDTNPPVISKMEYEGNIITMTFNEELNVYSVPAVSNFYVTVNDVMRPVVSVAVSDVTVKLTLSSAIVNGQPVKLSYSKPLTTTGGITDIVGNQTLSIGNYEVKPIVNTTSAAPVSGSANGSIVSITFNKALTTANSYAYSQFGISVDGTYYSPTAIYVSGSTVQLTFNGTASNSQAVYVSYSPGSYPIKDTDGINVNAFSSYRISGGTDTTPPSLISAVANGSTITLRYNESLNSSSVPYPGSYSVSVNSSIRTVTQVQVSGDQVILTLSSPVSSGDSIYVSYGAASPRITDQAGNAAASFSTINAPVGNASGLLAAGVVKGSTATLTFNESLNNYYVPSISQFMLQADGTNYSVSKVVLSGSTVTLTLSSPVGASSKVTMSYYGNSSTGLRTNSGKLIENFTNYTLTNQTSVIDSLPGGFEQAEGGGIGIQKSNATITGATSPAGKYVNKYTIPSEKIILAYQAARTLGSNNLRVVFQVPSTEGAAVVAFPLSALQSATYYGNNAAIAVQYNGISYDIPLSALNFSQIASSLNASGAVGDLLIQIDQGSSSLTSTLTSAISRANASSLAPPVHFDVSASYGGTVKPVQSFNGYLTRSMEAPYSIDRKTVSVVWYDPETGGLSYVPTTFTTVNGKMIAKFQRKGNSAYALVQGNVSFTDISKHWAGTTIQILAKKYIVEGRSTSKFEPEKPITRGEFASYIAKGLGLAGNKAAASKFRDVNTGTAMAAYIGAASEAGIVQGNSDGTFKPNSPISRQEMAVMMTRASKAAGVTVTLQSSTSSYLSKFSDRSKIASWAQTDVAKAVYTGVITGKTTTTFSPTTNATRAEAVVMIKRLLEKVNFLSA
ncbi:Ig-like domain-containing protein [Paenibacillus sp. NPDC058174]|uniref:Ig-like domain-containing protein n=1 Tax=Paenibacillus sp. NPDC058174 TaxID=3346366 RepID=UPI0036D7DFC7